MNGSGIIPNQTILNNEKNVETTDSPNTHDTMEGGYQQTVV